MSPDVTHQTGRFGVLSLTCLVVANTIGAGIYTTTGFTLRDMGTPQAVLAVWLIASLLALCGAMSYAALVRAMPLSGGEYVFLSRGLHPAAGFIAGWVSLVAGFAGAQAYGALAMTEYLSGPPALKKAGAVLVLIVLAVTHGRLVRFGTALQNLTVAAKAAFLLLFIGIGCWVLPGQREAVPTAEWGPSSASLELWAFNVLMVGLSFTGFNAAVYVAEECHNPRHDVPRALFLGTAITAALYLAVNAVYLFSAPLDQLSGSPRIALVAAEALGGEPLARGVQALVLLSLFTLLSGAAVAGPRVMKKMSEDGLLPPLSLARASAVQGGLAVTMTLVSNLVSQLAYLSLTLSLISALTVATVFRLPAEQRPPGIYPICYLLGAGVTTVAALSHDPVVGAVTVATFALGLVLYTFLTRGRP